MYNINIKSMICPLQQAFPEVNKNITESYTNVYNTNYSLVEDFTPKVYNIGDDKVFNSVEGNVAVMNNYSNDTPSTKYYTYINDDSNSSLKLNNKCVNCPKCQNPIYLKSQDQEDTTLIKDQNDLLIILGLTAFFYYIIN